MAIKVKVSGAPKISTSVPSIGLKINATVPSSGPKINALFPNGTQQRVSAATIFQGSDKSYTSVANAYNQANTAYNQANAAFSYANTSIQVTGGEITGNLIVDGRIYGNVAVIDAGTF